MDMPRELLNEHDQIAVPTILFGPWRARPLIEDDADLALDFLTDPGVIAARTPPPPADLAGAQEWVNQALVDPQCVPWVLEAAEDGRSVGYIAIQRFDRIVGAAEIGFLVLPAARRQGLATKALDAVTTWAFENLDEVHRLYLVHDTTNSGSCKAATAVGYIFEGINRSARPAQDGTRIDSEMHALVRPNYEATRTSRALGAE